MCLLGLLVAPGDRPVPLGMRLSTGLPNAIGPGQMAGLREAWTPECEWVQLEQRRCVLDEGSQQESHSAAAAL